MKKKKNSFLRLLKMLLLSSLAGGIIGGMVGAFLGYHGERLDQLTFLKDDVINLIILLNRLVVVTGLTLSFVFLTQLKKETAVYNTIEEDDISENGYRQLNKKHAYTMLLIAVASILSMCNVLLGLTLTNDSQHAMLAIPLLDILLLLMVIPFQALAMKRYNAIRGTDVPYFPNLKELKHNIMALDEAELQAYHKTSFESVLSLNGVIIPSLYVILFFVYLFTGQVELTAILVLVLIQLYLLVKSATITRQFYR
ncbi:TPA: DUF3169 family protein [Streptococcus pyogenes]|uniref:DUF3169 family protein n=1 Tax=Streptococcus pyogenes TaxID=1314 RepID=UPI00109C4A5F|nr:DUF3169 family protein [Streptococcus pyogenes]VGV20908.1 hypothetical membrane spanning protein [Streptococcus pyogenes]VHA76804.1 hypothetical membrane spanning protein [Streptococcus pyogenes]VHA86832.1 hypothetical membrane spanning protein [Streptococcus pyogenes]VHB80456.1 hypothetical membrane spanning protein [Streptococcus pyogenes]VHD00933.1 hypothetical membrane spanning protein [Streptococcus pyogenes]